MKFYKFRLPNEEIVTKRLRLKHWEDVDLPDLYEYGSVNGVGENAGWRHFRSEKDAEDFLEIFQSLGSVFCLYHVDDEKAIGTLDYDFDDEFEKEKVVSIGYSLSKDYWGQGIMVEAILGSIPFFKSHGVKALTASFYPYNRQSQRVLEKVGFTFYSEMEERDSNGRPVDGIKYILSL